MPRTDCNACHQKPNPSRETASLSYYTVLVNNTCCLVLLNGSFFRDIGSRIWRWPIRFYLPGTRSGARPLEVALGKQAFVFTWPFQIFQI